jgi:hypothetical protein
VLVLGRERGREGKRYRDTTREKRDENIVCVQPMSVSWEKGDNREREQTEKIYMLHTLVRCRINFS